MTFASTSKEARLFWKLRWKLIRALVIHATTRARLRTVLVVGLTVAFWLIMLVLFGDGFRLVRNTISHEGTRVEIAHAIFNVFFLALSIMLLISSAIILYGSIYRGRDTELLLTLPVRVQRIVLYKFQEAMFVACWGFFLLGSPLLLAYGYVADAPWYYYALLPAFMLAFVTIPCVAGAVCCLAVARYMPRWHRALAIGFGLVLLGALVWAAYTMLRQASPENMLSIEWFQMLLTRMKYSQQRLLPSWWLSTGLLEAAHPAVTAHRHATHESMGFLFVLTANAMLAYQILSGLAQRLYLDGRGAIAAAGTGSRRRRLEMVDRIVSAAFAPLPSAMRQLLVKDFRIFRRDTLQWSQLAIFGILLAFYFANVRRLHHGPSHTTWLTMISFLNVGVVGLLLATFTTRFIYPLISLEGRRIWVLGTSPIPRRTIVLGKFVFAVTISLLPCCVLILLSDVSLGMFGTQPTLIAAHQLLCVVLCLGLCAIATGFGALFPNLQESSPAKVASSFGGTLTLVVSAIFILVAVLATAIPTYYRVQQVMGSPTPKWWSHEFFYLGIVASLVLGVVATAFPLWMAVRRIHRMEF